jgi:GNAT superfamily N-acetyltransferase
VTSSTPTSASSRGIAQFVVRLENETWPSRWELNPGIEFWSCDISLTYDGTRNQPQAPVARGGFTVVAPNRTEDLIGDLDYISYDHGVVAGAILGAEEVLANCSIYQGADSTFLIADDVAVDTFWRGQGIGPALVLHAAYSLRVNAVFLQPAALRTRIGPDGACTTDYDAPRAGPAAQKKVEQAWRRVGFRKLGEGVVWLDTMQATGYDRNIGVEAAATLTKAEAGANDARSGAWWRRRIKRLTA